MSVIMNKVNAMADSADKKSKEETAKDLENKPITDDELSKQSQSSIAELADGVDKHKHELELAAHKSMIEEKELEKKADEEDLQDQLKITAMKKAQLLKDEQEEKPSLAQKTVPPMYGDLEDESAVQLDSEKHHHNLELNGGDMNMEIGVDEDTYEPDAPNGLNGLSETEMKQETEMKAEAITDAEENNQVHEGENSAPIDPSKISKAITVEEKLSGTDKPVADVRAEQKEENRLEPSASEIAMSEKQAMTEQDDEDELATDKNAENDMQAGEKVNENAVVEKKA